MQENRSHAFSHNGREHINLVLCKILIEKFCCWGEKNVIKKKKERNNLHDNWILPCRCIRSDNTLGRIEREREGERGSMKNVS